MPKDPEKDRMPTDSDNWWIRLLSLVTDVQRLGDRIQETARESSRGWTAALKTLAAQLRGESLQQHKDAQRSTSEVSSRMSTMEKRVAALEDRFGWVEEEMEKNGSHG